MVKEDSVNKFIDDLTKILNNDQEEDMEKYAVDKDDSVEKVAETLVKTGQVKNIKDGREAAVQSQNIAEETDDPEQ